MKTTYFGINVNGPAFTGITDLIETKEAVEVIDVREDFHRDHEEVQELELYTDCDKKYIVQYVIQDERIMVINYKRTV